MLPLRQERPEQPKTLVSWKEIAAFLDRAERTVKRWERERGLPVHRVPGGERGGVYAYPNELADWLNGKSSELETEDLLSSTREPDRTDQIRSPGAETVPPLAGETGERSERTRKAHPIRFAFIGIAALAGAGLYASFARPFGTWIERRVPATAGLRLASPTRPVAPQVSDAEIRVAHDLYLNGRFEWNQRTPESLNRALDDFTQAIVHNPNDARVYAGLADTYEMLFIYGSRQDDDARNRAMDAARKAVDLDVSLSEAHRALGYAIWRSGNFGEAEKELHLAIRLDPKDPLAHLWLSNVLASEGEMPECLAEINNAQELDPVSASILAVKGDRLYWMGMEKKGIALLKDALHSEPSLGIAHWYLAAIAYHRRDYPTYLKESQTTAEIRNDPWLKEVTAKLSSAYARDGERGLLHAEFAIQESCSPPAYPVFRVARTQKAIECLTNDRIPEALQLLEEANANQEQEFENFRTAFTSGSSREVNGPASKLADDPRFQSLMKQKAELSKPAKLASSHNSGML